eukprot:TRINITY_DN3290_c0_g2_i1.p1 TRINITY_DN3290_c0_g2~~TRINITY_DN3290_c0_g2_i1.p1  ORF type:complete len:440 (+),score=124.31 TRINITY_DN3290_c0_g2_i1:133-1320(+)
MAGSDETLPTLVVDIGEGTLKAGYGGENAPRKCFPTLLGQPRHPGLGGIMLGAKQDMFIGNDAKERQGLLATSCPIDRADIKDWGDIDKLLYQVFYLELMVTPDEHPVLLTEAPGRSRESREKLTELIFETYNAPALVLASTATMSLFATGRSTGMVIDSGVGATHLVPIWEGYTLRHHTQHLDIAGSDITDHLWNLLRERGLPFSTQADRNIVEDIKEQYCYSCLDYKQEVQHTAVSRSVDKLYTMPDGAQIKLVNDRFTAPEAMFNPKIIGKNCDGVQTAAHNCIQRCDSFIRNELYANITLAGGNTLFQQFDARLTREMEVLTTPASAIKNALALARDTSRPPIKVDARPERRFSAWLGSSLLASMPTFPTMWLAKKEYDEEGAHAMHRKAL